MRDQVRNGNVDNSIGLAVERGGTLLHQMMLEQLCERLVFVQSRSWLAPGGQPVDDVGEGVRPNSFDIA